MTNPISRRSFMTLPALAPLGALGSSLGADEHRFHYDHIIGTSLDLAVWTPHYIGSGGGTRNIARQAAQAVLAEIHRLTAILSTYDPESEISRFDRFEHREPSRELAEVLELYRIWENRTGGVLSVRPRGATTPLNVDALGKAYIIDRSAEAARLAVPDLAGLVLNIGGDIVVWGRECEVGITDPAAPADNADPLTRIVIRGGAVATSGTYLRGAHLIDARTGRTEIRASSSTVVARNAVTANALASTLCILNADEGMRLVERTRDAEALRIDRSGAVQRSSGFTAVERFRRVQQTTAANWPLGYEVSIAVTLKPIPPGEDAPYLAAWVEDATGKLVRAIVLWGSKDKYKPELSSFWIITGGSKDLLYKVSKVTRLPGTYKIVWNGLDDNGKPVPKGNYRIVIETNRYHGTYAKQSGMIACNDIAATTTLSGTTNFESIIIQYGPKPTAV